MSPEAARRVADKLLADLTARASRADAAEAELEELRRRLHTFHYEQAFRPEELADSQIVAAIERSIGARLGQDILEWTHGNPSMEQGYGAKRQKISPSRRRYTVTVLLEEKSGIEPELFVVED